MSKAKVVVVPCASYDEEQIFACLKTGVDALGGIQQFISHEEKILVKPNYLTPSDTDKAIVTHPSVIRGFLRLLNEACYVNVKCGDSPGHGSSKAAAQKIGLKEDNVYGAILADMNEEVLTRFPEGMTCREFYFCKEVVEAGAIIGLSKMKTHALERITGAVKLMYGLICGHRKAAGHVKFPNASIFARQLADIHRCVKPRLHIMDGVVAMEGNGPGSGTPVNMNVLLFSADPVALDTVFCYLVNLNPEFVPTNVQGAAMGIGTDREDEIEIVMAENGKDAEVLSRKQLFERFGSSTFDVPRGKPKRNLLSNFSSIMTRFARRPYIQEDKCIRCGICVSHCPVPGKAVEFRNGKGNPPVYDYSKCIRCYCCQEMCPQYAIQVKGKITK